MHEIKNKGLLITLPDTNELADWQPHFAAINIPPALLVQSFNQQTGLPNFQQLYSACWDRVKYSTISGYKIQIKTSWQLYCLAGESFIQRLIDNSGFETLRDNLGANITLYLLSQSQCRLAEKIFKKFPRLKNSKDNAGRNLLHYAAWSGSVSAIEWVLEKFPTLKDSKDNGGRNLLHYAAWFGSISAMECILEKFPALKDSKNNTGGNLLHYAALSGSAPAMEWVLKKYPTLKDSEDNVGRNLLHYAAWSTSISAMGWALEKFPTLKKGKDHYGANFLHYAARSGSIIAIEWALNQCPKLGDSKDKDGRNLLHYAGWSSSVSTIEWVLAKFPRLKNCKDHYGGNFLHYIARSGCVTSMGWALNQYPQLHDSKDEDGCNFLHYAVLSGCDSAITFLLQHYPLLMGRLWVKDKNGDTPHNLAPASMAKKPLAILQTLFKEALLRLGTDEPSPTWMHLLLEAFQDELGYYLCRVAHGLSVHRLQEIIHSGKLGPVLSEQLARSIPLLKLKEVTIKKEILSLSILQTLLINAKPALRVQPPDNSLYQTLKNFCTRLEMLGQEMLTEDAATTLSVILNDHQRSPNHHTQEVDQILMNKLLGSATLMTLRPQPELSTERDIQPTKYVEHFNALKTALMKTSLSADTKRIMIETLLPGLRHIVEHEDNIIQHVIDHYGVLYELAPNLPLHTDHITTNQPEAYRNMLSRLVKDCLGAFYIAQSAGKLVGFFDRLAQGYCLEGRVRDALTWVVAFSEIKPFNDFMQQACKEYIAYQKIMLSKTNEEVSQLAEAIQFIMLRYKGFPCELDENYAPMGDITQDGVRRYLEEILSFDDAPVVFGKKSLLIKKVDDHIQSRKRYCFFISFNEKEEALSILRLGLTNKKESTKIGVIIERWGRCLNKNNKTHLSLIAEHRNPLSRLIGFFGIKAKTETERLIAELALPSMKRAKSRCKFLSSI